MEDVRCGCAGKPPVNRDYLKITQDTLFETIQKAIKSENPDVSLAGIAILSKYEKLVDVINDIKNWGLKKK